MMPTDLDPRQKKVLSAYPVRNPVKWRLEEGRAVIIYKKTLTRVEKKLMQVIGGKDNIRRKLDAQGTDIWLMCDGDHTILDICYEMDRKYKEEMEPVVKRVGQFIEILLRLSLVTLRQAEEAGGETDGDARSREGAS